MCQVSDRVLEQHWLYMTVILSVKSLEQYLLRCSSKDKKVNIYFIYNIVYNCQVLTEGILVLCDFSIQCWEWTDPTLLELSFLTLLTWYFISTWCSLLAIWIWDAFHTNPRVYWLRIVLGTVWGTDVDMFHYRVLGEISHFAATLQKKTRIKWFFQL